jgi:hypothetical protein
MSNLTVERVFIFLITFFIFDQQTNILLFLEAPEGKSEASIAKFEQF